MGACAEGRGRAGQWENDKGQGDAAHPC
jgi:hypothetical protein